MADIKDALLQLGKNSSLKIFGKVSKIAGLVVEGQGLSLPLGSLCAIYPASGDERILAEVVGFQDTVTLLMPLQDVRGVAPGCLIESISFSPTITVGRSLLGRVIDPFIAPLDKKGPLSFEAEVPLYASPPNPMDRPRIREALDVGVRAINAFTTLGKGQRIGIMAGSGVGKSTLLGMMARSTKADINVIALVGERGREVVEFIEESLGEEGLARSVLIIATSDSSPLLRMRAAYTATAIAEYFRDLGNDVLFMMDSVTRFAMASREIGLSIGEPPTRGGYTPSVFAQLPQLLERTGRNEFGSITGVYTVLVDGDDFNDPVADSVRSILDGHIVLSRELASLNHFPAIDVLSSVSRLQSDVMEPDMLKRCRGLLQHLARYKKMEDMINIGAYQTGSNANIDKAIAMQEPINEFLQQETHEPRNLEETFEEVRLLSER